MMSSRYADLLQGDPDKAAMQSIMRIVLREAHVLTYADCFLIMSGVFFATLLLMPLVRSPKAKGGGGGGH